METVFLEVVEMENRKQINRSVIVICGVLLGVILIAFGVYRNINSEYSKLNLPTAEKIQAEINEAYQRLETDRKALLDEFDKNGKSDEYNAINRRIQEREVERANLEERLLRINNHEYDGVKKDTINKSVPFFVGGIVVILATLIISGVLFSLQQGRKKINKKVL
jgi:hypothetical protein